MQMIRATLGQRVSERQKLHPIENRFSLHLRNLPVINFVTLSTHSLKIFKVSVFVTQYTLYYKHLVLKTKFQLIF